MRCKYLCFGVNSAPEQFQYAIQQTLERLEGVRNIADSIIVWGKSLKEHDTHIEARMKRLSENNVILNVSKCKFNVDSIWFCGYTLSKDGISADKTKIAALVNMKEPEDVSQLRSFLGLATYCERFINNLATITAPLRELTNKGVVWKWTGGHQQAFNKVKEGIAKDSGHTNNNKNDNNIDLTPYHSICNELTVSDNGIVLPGNRLVMLKKLRSHTLNIGHAQYQGIVKTKTLLRTKVWWPGIDREVEPLIASCIHCQAANNSKIFEPLKMTTMPSKPWQVIHGDFYGPFPSGEYLLVLMDEHSRFPEVETIRSTTTAVTIGKLDKIFSVHGFPIEFVSDNGPPFNGHEFHNYLTQNGIKHRKITPILAAGRRPTHT
ncbi:Transposon Ty3-I Gag-Pol poly [Paramuricea clavata]|uniref:Transposon Ty3-I Gag-Pol poly n=1 Tax=Paramuricea clavata TaxID=317549 RepID=A0A6S7JR98_PARCT|nr:Transposon Ty3-I Gag-Pol poly [Paramuricea clavata]